MRKTASMPVQCAEKMTQADLAQSHGRPFQLVVGRGIPVRLKPDTTDYLRQSR